MKKLYFTLIISLFSLSLISQGCLPEGISFSTQEEIDSFQTNYPNCTEIEGGVSIFYGENITNLNGLSVLTSVNGYIHIEGNPELDNLTGLVSLTSIGEALTIINSALTSLTGLESLISIGGDLRIGIAFNGWVQPNPNLSNISALENLTSIGQSLMIVENESLASLSGLENLTSIGWSLAINGNSSLTSLTGLDNISAGSIGNLDIVGNELLSTCEVQSICDYLVSPNGNINIYSNATGCNSQTEVEEACETVGIQTNNFDSEFLIYPNPATNKLFITSNNGLKIETVNIYNQFGQIVLKRNEIRENIDISTLVQGIYIIEVTSDKLKVREKLKIEK